MTLEVEASEVKAHLARPLDEVERGETVIITRHGRAIARIIPEAHRRQQEIDEAIADIEDSVSRLEKRQSKRSSR